MDNEEDFDFKKLHVWQKAVDFADLVIATMESIESRRNHYRLLEQAEAASTSVAMNIAEGKGRFSKKEYVQFLYYARGSLFETITLMEIIYKRRWIELSQLQAINSEGIIIAKMLNKLISTIKKNNSS